LAPATHDVGYKLRGRDDDMTDIRKVTVYYEETKREVGKVVDPPARKAVIAAAVLNPYAGTYSEDLSALVETGAELGKFLAERTLDVLSAEADGIQSYGKGAIVGLDGELEHAAAVLHPRFGAPVRAAVGGSELIPATKRVGPPGCSLSIPLAGKLDLWNLDQWDAAEIAVPDAPRADEILVCFAVGAGGRPLSRVQPVR
jgi:Amino acid synthesis